ncbi:hypothetical protein [Micromonospora sp. WMMD998]|uniref:hypothetical protein n=1 Tax=Micromonospora sp. WMMD998 TaxID=3016092 RepID=UPI00249A79AD|nr:hypothetical protein [Micromonospora sp. WMMD998]WFE37076.1 hypothetical protein O7619_00955 [Micromonospora sp. WMMD998]
MPDEKPTPPTSAAKAVHHLDPDRRTNVAPESRWSPRTPSGWPSAHVADGPAWICARCGHDWPCPTLRAAPTDVARRATLIPEFARLTRRAIRDLRGRADGPTPPEIVKRFLWFMSLSDDEARAVALRLR